MEVTMLRDKLDTGMRARFDNLSIEEYVRIELLVKHELEREKEFFKTLKSDDEIDKTLKQSALEDIGIYKNILSAIENEKTIQLDCYRSNTKQESFATMVKKYKKIEGVK